MLPRTCDWCGVVCEGPHLLKTHQGYAKSRGSQTRAGAVLPIAPPLLFVPKQGRRVIWGHAPSRAGVRFLWRAPYLLFVPKQGYTLLYGGMP